MKTVLLLIGFILASIHFAEAQQSSKIPRIGWLAFLETLRRIIDSHSLKVYDLWVGSKARTFRLNADTPTRATLCLLQ